MLEDARRTPVQRRGRESSHGFRPSPWQYPGSAPVMGGVEGPKFCHSKVSDRFPIG